MSFLSFFENVWDDLFGTGANAANTRATIVKDVGVALNLVQTAIGAVESQGLIGTADRAHIDEAMAGARRVAGALGSESSASEIGNAISMLQIAAGLLPDGTAKAAATVALDAAAALLPALMVAVSGPVHSGASALA